MPDELSRYQQACAKVCEWCARGWCIRSDGWHIPNSMNHVLQKCTAPTLAEFNESESRRADALQQECDQLKAQLAGAAVCDCYDIYPGEGPFDFDVLRSDPDCSVCGGRGVVLGGEKAR